MNAAQTHNTDVMHRESVFIDAHCDTLIQVITRDRRLGERSSEGQFDLPRAIEGGLTAELMAMSFSPDRRGNRAHQTFQFLDAFHETIETYPDLAVGAFCAEDILRAKKSGKVALVLAVEGAEVLEGDLRILRLCYRLGMRFLGVTWNRRNEAADGVEERGTGGGLTQFGVDLVRECNRLGVVLDIAHLAPAGVEDVLALTDAPIVATHANSHRLWPHPRNLTDEQLEAVAEKGGVVGVTPVPPFLGENEERSSLSVLLDHVDHMVKVMGEDGVGFGLDFDGVGEMRTEGIEDVSMLPNLTRGLVQRGYSAQAVRKISGENLLRVIRQVVG